MGDEKSGAVSASPGGSSTSTACQVGSHVRFDAKEVSTHESEIDVIQKEEGVDDVHLGFLKIRHIYDITFNVVHNLGKDITFDPLESLLVKIKKATPTEDGHRLTVEFNAQKEKLMKEKLTLRSASSSDVHFMILHARVLGKNKGTPSLKNGIHCTKVEPDDDEGSDWQGF